MRPSLIPDGWYRYGVRLGAKGGGTGNSYYRKWTNGPQLCGWEGIPVLSQWMDEDTRKTPDANPLQVRIAGTPHKFPDAFYRYSFCGEQFYREWSNAVKGYGG